MIAACLIGGDDVTKEEWERVTESALTAGASRVFLGWNGKRKMPPRWMRTNGRFVEWAKRDWDDDFAAARNANFAQVPRDQFRWIIWLDKDDELVSPDGLGALVESLDPLTRGVFLRYDYGIDAETGEVLVPQWRERLLATDIPWRWTYAIHEVCAHPPGTQLASRDTAWVVHHRGAHRDESTRERNRRIVARERRLHPEVPRWSFYMAKELFTEAYASQGPERARLFELAEEELVSFVPRAPNSEDAYQATHMIADICRLRGDNSRALDMDLQCVKLMPSWPEAYVGLASSCLALGEPDRAIEWCKISLSIVSMPHTTQAIDAQSVVYLPHYLAACAHEQKGELELALQEAELAVAERPTREATEKLGEIRAKVEAQEAPSDIERPTRKSLYGTLPHKSIAFFTKPLFEPWHPALEAEHGAGGAETCIMRLAPRLAAKGWRVAVFGTPGDREGVDPETGVEWWPSMEWNPLEPFSVFVSSRAPEVFDSYLRSRVNLLWMHDVNAREELLPDRGSFGSRWAKIDSVLALSDWHAHHLRRLYGMPASMVQVMRNGIEPSAFVPFQDLQLAHRREMRFVYASSPDRGLDVLLGLWEKVRQKWPEATLDIFYGWDAIDRIIAAYPGTDTGIGLSQFRGWIEEMLDALGREEGGVRWRGRVPQAQMQAELAQVSMWLYPTYFCETSCITALEMQAAGVVPVTSRLAALTETLASWDEHLVDGWPNNESYQRQWIDKLVELAGAEKDYLLARRLVAWRHAQMLTWDRQTEAWERMLAKLLYTAPAERKVVSMA